VYKRLRQEAGFGLIELLMAMVILNIGILVVVAAFNSGIVTLRRSGMISNASVLADKQMELYRSLTYGAIALDPTSIPARRRTRPIRRTRPRR
jgi:Tfp pilus assembly protein PilV